MSANLNSGRHQRCTAVLAVPCIAAVVSDTSQCLHCASPAVSGSPHSEVLGEQNDSTVPPCRLQGIPAFCVMTNVTEAATCALCQPCCVWHHLHSSTRQSRQHMRYAMCGMNARAFNLRCVTVPAHQALDIDEELELPTPSLCWP